jgi:NTP pyrophosphatase (non-canonical NTP hydrolase)
MSNNDSLTSLIEAIEAFHAKNGFDIRTKNIQTLLYRQNLLMEELGEISQCITKDKGNLAEEHADLLILMLGNCITMDIDIVSEVWKKLEKINQRTGKQVAGQTRVSDWNE